MIAVIEEPAETGLVRTRVQCEALNLGLEQRIDLSGSGESVSVADPTSNGARVESITVARELPADQRVFAAPAVNAAASEKGSLLERQVLDAQQALQQVQRFDVPWLQIQVGTGKVQTNGPGSLAVWLPASQMNQMSSTLATAPPRDGWGNTQIKFDQGIEGDLHRSDFTFRNNVRVLHGSVTGPDESLDADRSELIGDRYRLRANELRVVQWQESTEVEPHLEMIAQGQLQLDGELFRPWPNG